MIVNADAAQLEWRCAVHLANDPVGIEEIYNGVKIHDRNKETFNLPSKLIAKKFIFRLIYGGTAYTYTVDPEFTDVSKDIGFWQAVIDRFYAKYTGIYAMHQRWLKEAGETGCIVMPTGRIYEFRPITRGGEVKLPDTDIKNYPVQGFAADLMAIIRVALGTKLRKSCLRQADFKLINTVHDSIMLDVKPDRSVWYPICNMINEAFLECPANFEKLFNTKLLVPIGCEISVGLDWQRQHELKF